MPLTKGTSASTAFSESPQIGRCASFTGVHSDSITINFYGIEHSSSVPEYHSASSCLTFSSLCFISFMTVTNSLLQHIAPALIILFTHVVCIHILRHYHAITLDCTCSHYLHGHLHTHSYLYDGITYHHALYFPALCSFISFMTTFISYGSVSLIHSRRIHPHPSSLITLYPIFYPCIVSPLNTSKVGHVMIFGRYMCLFIFLFSSLVVISLC